ncbi:MAG: PadR family transcriptional regulator [Flavobacteriaceae bacterium]
MNISTLCLAILSFGEATGYEIRKLSVEGSFSYFVDASFGAIYPALARLANEGCLTVRDEVQPGKPARKIYAITDKGRAELEKSLVEGPAADRIKSEFLLTALCAEYLDRARMDAHLDAHVGRIIAQSQECRKIVSEECQDHVPTQWVVDFALAMNAAKLKFIEENRERLLAVTRQDGSLKSSTRQAAE